MYLLEGGALPRAPEAVLRQEPSTIRDDRIELDGPGGAGRRYRTNVVASDLVRVSTPWRIVGHDRNGLVVVGAPDGGARLVAEAARPLPVALGAGVSLVALGLVVAAGALLLGRAGLRSLSGRARRA
jgi:hypothetical protein